MLRLGIDLGGTKTEGVVIDANGDVLRRERLATPAADGYEAILSNIEALVADLETGCGRCHVGVGTPGAISTRTGLLKNSNTTCLNGKPILDDLQRRLARPIRVANDANCFALAEALDGAGRDAAVVFGVIIGTGVGGGIVIRGQLLEGRQHIAGEWGHNVLEPDGPPCYCGRRGCVETFLSGPGLVRDYQLHGGASASDALEVVRRAASGEASAQAALTRYLDRFGRALATVINIVDPDVVVLGGGLSNIEALYRDGPARVASHLFAAHGGTHAEGMQTQIRRNLHGDSGGVRGAALLWRDTMT